MNGVPIYAQGEGLTVSTWVRLTGEGLLHPIEVEGVGDRSDLVLLSLFRTEGEIHLLWKANQQDGFHRAFTCNTSITATNGSIAPPCSIQTERLPSSISMAKKPHV